MSLLEKSNTKIINKDEYEECVICHQLTEVKKDTEIDFRSFYIEGAGQLCEKCYHEIYKKNIKK
jgi:recombinational DNA repair protein (RecF pathway)